MARGEQFGNQIEDLLAELCAFLRLEIELQLFFHLLLTLLLKLQLIELCAESLQIIDNVWLQSVLTPIVALAREYARIRKQFFKLVICFNRACRYNFRVALLHRQILDHFIASFLIG